MKKSLLSSVYYIKYAVHYGKWYTFFLCLLRFLLALAPSIQILVIANFLDNAQVAFIGGIFTKKLVQSILLLLIFILTQCFIEIIGDYIKWRFDLITGNSYDIILTEKRSKLKFYLTEDKDTLDLIQKITENSSEKIGNGIGNLLDICEYVIRIGGIVITICNKNVAIGLFVLIIFLIIVPTAKKCGEEDYKAYAEATKKFRKAAYFRKVLSHRDFVEERKTFGYTETMNQKWEQYYEEGRSLSQRVTKRNFIYIKLAGISTIGMAVLIAGILLLPLKEGTMSIGIYISIVTAVMNLIKMMSWNLAYIIEDYTSYKEYMLAVLEFLNLEEIKIENVEKNYCNIDSVRFENVSFCYPKTTKYVLKNVSFVMTKGKTYALVGENGTGKSTIVKLLLGLYDNYEGNIYINEKEIRNMSKSERNNYFTVAYQDFAKFEMSLRDNLTLGSIEDEDISEEELMKCIQKMGLMECVKHLPEGLNTPLGRLEEKGYDLSGGQWQRIAIVRMLLRKAPIRIMDEPTAALDPVHEQKIYQILSEAEENILQIMITHRLGGIQKADCIFTFVEGELREKGTHEDLIEKEGIYSQMFEAQRRWYI